MRRKSLNTLNILRIKNKKTKTALLIFFGLAALSLFNEPATTQNTSPAVYIIDGDTFNFDGQRIRLWGVDAPEMKQICKISNQPYKCGEKAKAALKAIIGDQRVSCETVDIDRYERAVSKCNAGGQDIALQMTLKGWAVDYRQYSKGAYAVAEAQAKEEGRGLWVGSFKKPWEYRHSKKAAQ